MTDLIIAFSVENDPIKTKGYQSNYHFMMIDHKMIIIHQNDPEIG